MNISNIVVPVVITGLVQGLIGLLTYKLIERQDRKLDVLSDRVQTLEDQKIERIEQRLASGSDEFEAINGEIKQTIRRGDFLLHQEACDKRITDLTREVRAQATETAKIARELSGVAVAVNLIVSRLNITMGGKK